MVLHISKWLWYYYLMRIKKEFIMNRTLLACNTVNTFLMGIYATKHCDIHHKSYAEFFGSIVDSIRNNFILLLKSQFFYNVNGILINLYMLKTIINHKLNDRLDKLWVDMYLKNIILSTLK